jgi:RHH-type rel operon transcriptional repressor/antitoxin RelB
MTKTATIGIRVDEELKNEASAAFEDMGMTMSMAVELFLKYVADNKKLPFSTAAQEHQDYEKAGEIWRMFVEWQFDVNPRFDTPEAEQIARERLGFDRYPAGRTAREYIDRIGAGDDSLERDEAKADIYRMAASLDMAKDIIYGALNAPQVFVPVLADANEENRDAWRLELLRRQVTEKLPQDVYDLDEDELMDYVEKWLAITDSVKLTDDAIYTLEHAIDGAEVFDTLDDIELFSDFADYVEDSLLSKYDRELKAGLAADRAEFKRLLKLRTETAE